MISQAWTGLVVCGIQGSGIQNAPVFSQKEEEEPAARCSDAAFVNKTQRAWFLLPVLARGVDERHDWWRSRESKGDIRAGLGSH